MKNGIEAMVKKDLSPYEVRQALAGVTFRNADNSIYKYLNYFAEQVPIKSLQILHVVPGISLMDNLIGKASDSIFNIELSFETEELEVQKSINSSLPEGLEIPYDIAVSEGNPLEEFLKKAKNINADLLVLGRKKGDTNHGILAKNLTRKTAANVLVIPEDSKADISNILVPLDFSPNSARALYAAIRLHKQLKRPAKITALHVYTMPNVSSFKASRSHTQFKKIVEENLQDAFNAFLHTEAGDYKERIELALVEKDLPGTSHYILDYADDSEADFMVIGAKGHSKIHLLLMGSVAEHVFDDNDFIPTLIVK